MDFISAVKICFKKYGDFNGRASRSEFWYFYLFGIIVGILSYYIAIQTYTFAIIYITGLPLLSEAKKHLISAKILPGARTG